MPEHNPGQMGGTMRLGKRRTIFRSKNSVMSEYPHRTSDDARWFSPSDVRRFLTAEKLYGNVDYVDERHRHRFEVESRTTKRDE